MRPTRITTISAGTLALTLSLASCSADEAPPTNSSSMQGEQAYPSEPRDEAMTSPTPAPTTQAYRDGEYSATGWYGSAPSHHDVTVTIENDTLTSVTITTPAENETSLGYQQRFAEALPEAVIGRTIDEIQIDRLAGASGSPQGFMDALAQIKAEAAE
jgi:uncharacterized protein with FMN-binding domain